MKNLKNSFVGFVFLLVIGQFYSCSKNPKCWGDDKNKGIISKDIKLDLVCNPLTNQTEFIILDDVTFFQTFDSTCTLPSIDFNKESLLGYYAEGGCEVKYIREVTFVESEKKYHYKVTIKDCGSCKKLQASYNWVTVPKLPNGWTVTFEMKKK